MIMNMHLDLKRAMHTKVSTATSMQVFRKCSFFSWRLPFHELNSILQTLYWRRSGSTTYLPTYRSRIQQAPPDRTALCHPRDKWFGRLCTHAPHSLHTYVAAKHRLCGRKAVWYRCHHFHRVRSCRHPLLSMIDQDTHPISSFSHTPTSCSATNV